MQENIFTTDGTNEQIVNLSRFTKGIYVLQLKTAEGEHLAINTIPHADLSTRFRGNRLCDVKGDDGSEREAGLLR